MISVVQRANPRVLAGAAHEAIARLRRESTEGRRSLPIGREPEELRRLWQDPGARAAVLAGIPVSDATLEVGGERDEWGTTVALVLRLERPMPGVASQALAGKAVRRFKALAETDEVPTTERNPSARPDAGEAAV